MAETISTETPLDKTFQNIDKSGRIFFKTFCFISFAAYIFFLCVRLPEVIAFNSSTLVKAMILVSFVAIITCFTNPPRLGSQMIKRVGLAGLVIFQIKSEMDTGVKSQSENYIRDLSGSVTIVTGANSGTGFAISKLLYHLGGTVVMTCRSEDKCASAIAAIKNSSRDEEYLKQEYPVAQLVPMLLDMNDLASVQRFSHEFKSKFSRLDHLVLNAGSIPDMSSRTVQGLEAAIGTMHVANVALVKWLTDSLLTIPPSLGDASQDITASRVVYVGSFAYVSGAFHSSLFDGTGAGDFNGEITDNCGNFGPMNLMSCCPIFACPITNGYGRAKLANMFHAFEFQRRVDERGVAAPDGSKPRRLLTSVLHPGSVATNIHPALASQVVGLFLRPSDSAAYVILHAMLSNDVLPASYIDSMKEPHDLFDYRKNHLPKHLEGFPDAKNQYYAAPLGITVPSFDRWWFKKKQVFCADCEARGMGKISAETVAARLWDVTEQIIADWEAGKPVLTTPVISSSNVLEEFY